MSLSSCHLATVQHLRFRPCARHCVRYKCLCTLCICILSSGSVVCITGLQDNVDHVDVFVGWLSQRVASTQIADEGQRQISGTGRN